MGAWDAVKYGWNVVYWVTIEGIPTIFTERALGLTLPSGYEAEDASLVIDDSSEIGSEIDRRRGLGAGLSLGFRLLDTATVRQYIKLPAHTAELTQDESATANTIHVESTSGWPATGRFWLGHELVTYTGKTATTFTGCARGIVGLAYQHRLVSAGNLATSSPRWWRGRVVTLWASPVNQAGLPSGTTLQTDAVQVWRGKVSDGPNRAMAWWDFQADALERVLDRPLAAKLSGKIVPTATIYLAPTQMVCSFKVVAKNAAGATQWAYDFEFSPFATSNPTTYFSGDQLRQRIALQFVSAMTQAGGIANVDNLIWQPVAAEAGKGGQVMPGYRAAISYPGNGNVYNLYQDLSFVCGTKGHLSTQGWQYFPAALPATVLATDWYTGDSPLESQEFFGAYTDFITVQLDSGLDALIPTKGLLKIKPKQDKPPFVAVYKGRTFGAAGVVFGPLKLANGTGIPAVSMNELMGGSVEVIFTDEGSANVLALRCLESSGTGLRSATYDMLNEASGYGLPSGYVDEDTFGALLGSGPVGQLDLRTSPGGASFADIFGGLLVLAQLAVVSRTVDGRTSLACVRTTTTSRSRMPICFRSVAMLSTSRRS
jgi:hypothetical protein